MTTDGAWEAGPPPGADRDEVRVAGSVLRFMWDFGVAVPLWDADGILPSDPAWLHEALGLDAGLVADLAAWSAEMQKLDDDPRLGSPKAFRALDRAAKKLVARVQEAVGGDRTVEYVPW